MVEEGKRFEKVIEPQADPVSAPGIPARSYYEVIHKVEEGAEYKTAGSAPENLVKKEVEEQVRYVPTREVDFVEVSARTDGWVKYDKDGDPYLLMYEHGRVGKIELGRIFSGSGDKKKVDRIRLLQNGRDIRYIEDTVAIIKKDSVTFVDPLCGNYDSDRGLQGIKIDRSRTVSHFWADSPCLDQEIQHAAYLAMEEKNRRESKGRPEHSKGYLVSH